MAVSNGTPRSPQTENLNQYLIIRSDPIERTKTSGLCEKKEAEQNFGWRWAKKKRRTICISGASEIGESIGTEVSDRDRRDDHEHDVEQERVQHRLSDFHREHGEDCDGEDES